MSYAFLTHLTREQRVMGLSLTRCPRSVVPEHLDWPLIAIGLVLVYWLTKV